MAVSGICYLLAVLVFFLWTGNVLQRNSAGKKTLLALNDIKEAAKEGGLSAEAFSGKDFGADFIVLDSNEKIIYSSAGSGASGKITVTEAVMKGYPYSCILRNGELIGYVILMNGALSGMNSLRYTMTALFALCGLILLCIVFTAGLYIRKNIVLPFKRLEGFAARVAEGQLEEPLPMDRNHLFGAFSESFDIMREELSRSRTRELELQKKERELVASLSHDLKTPVTGIRLTAELMKAKLSMETPDPSDLTEKADQICKKADQIDVLVSDLFDSALDDLGQFKVSCVDIESGILSEIIRKYDDKNLVRSAEIPGVIIRVDEKRMGQVIGNILSNSEKYAGTPIDVEYELSDGFLLMRIKDTGPGVPSDETELVLNKFYRGRQWRESGKNGNGLGLYIARTLMELMGGKLVIERPEKGFCAALFIPLA